MFRPRPSEEEEMQVDCEPIPLIRLSEPDSITEPEKLLEKPDVPVSMSSLHMELDYDSVLIRRC